VRIRKPRVRDSELYTCRTAITLAFSSSWKR